MSHVPIETAEEDAADLQFPKGKHPPEFAEKRPLIWLLFVPSVTENQSQCDACHTELSAPYIKCAECKQKSTQNVLRSFQMCLKCFASGAETGLHMNTHSYIIVHNNVKVFSNTTWSARENCMLLDQLESKGFANWSDISRSLGTYSAEECRDYYLQNFFDGLFRESCQLTKFPYTRIDVPYLYRQNSYDPPRCKLDDLQKKCSANYRFARSDFDTPFDSGAERVIGDVQLDSEENDEYSNILADLNCSLVNVYNNRLR